MQPRATFTAHLAAALTAAIILGLCQIVVETIFIAAWAHKFLLGPYSLLGTQMYDFCVKVAAALPLTGGWLHGGQLDRFVGEGFFLKLALARALFVPNFLILGVLAFVIGSVRFLLRRPARRLPVLLTLAAFGLVVHAVVFGQFFVVPGSIALLIAKVARLVLSDGTGVALAVLVAATLAAAAIVRLPQMAHWLSLGALAAAVVVLCVGSTPTSDAAPTAGISPRPPLPAGQRPKIENVLLISIDSLRADRLGCYGNSRDTSPTIDQVARQGIRFANARSVTSWTLPSHMTMLTGRSMLSHRVILQKDRLPEGVPTLAETLRQGGLTTAGIVSATFLNHTFGFDRGFDYYEDRVATGAFRPDKPDETKPLVTEFDPLQWDSEAAIDYVLRFESAPLVTDLALSWLRNNHDKRFFLFVHFWDVHYDYVPPPPFDTMFDPDYKGNINGVDFFSNPAVRKDMPARDLEHLLALYDGEIRWTDGHVAQILAALDDLGIADRTAVIITADHGDEFFEHGNKGHRKTLYNEVLHVPLVMRIPGQPAGRVVEDPVSLMDIAPTILDLTGVAEPQGVEGASLTSVIENGEPAPQQQYYAFLCDLVTGARCQAKQSSPAGSLITRFQPLANEFYAAEDPLEKHNIASTTDWPRGDALGRLQKTLNSTWLPNLALGNRGAMKLDGATQERLRALGYF